MKSSSPTVEVSQQLKVSSIQKLAVIYIDISKFNLSSQERNGRLHITASVHPKRHF